MNTATTKARKYFILVGKHGDQSAPYEMIFGDYVRGPVDYEKEVNSSFVAMRVITLLADSQQDIDIAVQKLNS